MIKEIVGDIFEEFEAGRVNVIVHQANCFHTMGSGIARIIAQRYPVASERDNETLRGDVDKLGSYSFAKIKGKGIIVNVYSQYDTCSMANTAEGQRNYIADAMARSGRATRYDAIVAAFETLRRSIEASGKEEDYTLGFPYGYGSDMAGGSWTVVRAIIESVFGDSKINVVIVRLPDKKDLK